MLSFFLDKMCESDKMKYDHTPVGCLHVSINILNAR